MSPNDSLQNTIELAFQDLSTGTDLIFALNAFYSNTKYAAYFTTFQQFLKGRLRPQFWTAKPIRLPSVGEFSDIHIYDHVAICIGLEQIDQLQANERRFGNYLFIDLDEKTQYSFGLPVQQLS